MTSSSFILHCWTMPAFGSPSSELEPEGSPRRERSPGRRRERFASGTGPPPEVYDSPSAHYNRAMGVPTRPRTVRTPTTAVVVAAVLAIAVAGLATWTLFHAD